MKHLESELQIACVRWFDYQYPKYKLNLFSIPNEGARTPQNGARMKAMGRRAGTADMFLAVPKLLCHGLFIEFKTSKGKQTPVQIAFQNCVIWEGYNYQIITSFDEFKSLIETYLSTTDSF